MPDPQAPPGKPPGEARDDERNLVERRPAEDLAEERHLLETAPGPGKTTRGLHDLRKLHPSGSVSKTSYTENAGTI
jgi:hypothetical protein